MIGAFALVPMIIGAGLAVDYVRLSAVRSELQRSVDAAALAGARVVAAYPPNDGAVVADSRRYFWANFRSGLAGSSVGNAEPSVAVVEPERSSVNVQATAVVPVLLVGAVSALLPNNGGTISSFTLRASATAQKYQRGMELVLALDTTSSMATSDRLTNLKRGANDLLDIIFGAGNDQRGSLDCSRRDVNGNCAIDPSLLVGVVPFVATVNIGPARARAGAVAAIVDSARVNAVGWGNGPGGANSWKGCVMARPAPFEEGQADATPTASPFEPYAWPPTAPAVVWGGQTYAGPNYWMSSGTTEPWPAWPVAGDAFNRQNIGWGAGRDAAGPNRGCGYPILPLQPSKSIAKQHIAELQVGAANGTTVTLGFSWAWRLLSPDWRAWWQGGTWYTYRGATRTETTTPMGSPRDYDPLVDKVVVLFTDGQNEMGNGAANSAESCCTSAYGDWATRPLGANPVTELNRRAVDVCTAIKARGIKVFVVLLYANPPPAILNTFNENGCASGPTYFFNTPTGDDLRQIFREIGSHLSNLRLIH